jgi:biotin operon repressor
MRFVQQLHVLDRLDQLIRLKSTGNYQTLANRLGISARNVYNLIDVLKELGAQVAYCKERKSFYYLNEVNFSFSGILNQG